MFQSWINRYRNYVSDEQSAFDCINEFKEIVSFSKIICYGAGTIGTALASCFEKYGIVVELFIDRVLEGEKIFKPDYLSNIDLKEYVIIGTVNSNNLIDIQKELKHKNINAHLENGYDMLGIFLACQCVRDISVQGKVDIRCCITCPIHYEYCGVLMKSMQDQYSFSCIDFPHPINRIDIDLGCACNLNCRYCSIGIPYVKNPKLYEVEVVKKDIAKIGETLPYLQFCFMAGGEPSLHPQFAEILAYMIETLPYTVFCICVNAVDTPPKKALEILFNPRVVVLVSKYACLDEKKLQEIDRTLAAFKEYSIQYSLKEAVTWFDNNDCDFYEDPEYSLEKRHDACFMRCVFDWTIAEGILHYCSHDYFGSLTGLIPDNDNRIHIHDYNKQELLEKLTELHHVKFIEACKYCKAPYHNGIVGAGEQM